MKKWLVVVAVFILALTSVSVAEETYSPAQVANEGLDHNRYFNWLPFSLFGRRLCHPAPDTSTPNVCASNADLCSSPAIVLLFISSTLAAWFVLVNEWGRASVSHQVDWIEAIFASFVSLTVLVGWTGVILGTLGFFRLEILSGVLVILTGFFVWLRWPLVLPKFLPPCWQDLLLVALLALASLFYFRPHEYVLGGTDAGTYVNIGANLAREGTFISESSWMELLSDHRAVTMREQPPAMRSRFLQFVGWYIDDTKSSRVIPQFFPFHPALIGVGMKVAGLWGGLLVTPLWAIAGTVGVYLLTRRLFGRHVALSAVLLLAFSPIQIFFSRYPTAEQLTMLLLFAGLLAFQVLWEEQDAGPAWGILGGIAFGSAFLTRIDLPVVLVILVGALIIRRWRNRWSPGWSAFVIALTLFSIHAVLSALAVSWPYTWNTYSSILRLLFSSKGVIMAIGGALVLIGGIISLFWLNSEQQRLQEADYEVWIRRLLSLFVVVSSAYAYFVRPAVGATLSYSQWPTGSQVPVLNELNWVRMGWYLTPLGLILATGGLVVIIREESLDQLGVFLLVGVLTTIQYVYRSFIPSYHIYMMRRYVPIVIPMLIVYAAVAIFSIWDRRSDWLGRGPALLLLLCLSIGIISRSWPFFGQRDFSGAVEEMARLHAKLKQDAIIVINSSSRSMFADTVGVPLHFIFGHDVATVRKGDMQQLDAFVSHLQTYATGRDKPVQLIAMDPVDPALPALVTLEPVETVSVDLQRLENTYDAFPRERQSIYYGIEIYDLKAKNATPANESVFVDVGAMDAVFIREGFGNKERVPGAPTARWTSGKAEIDLPISKGRLVTVEVRAMTYRPESVQAVPVTVKLDGRELGQFTPERDWGIFSLQGRTSTQSGVSSLSFETTTFNPAQLGVSSDTRDLGFLIDWIRVEPRPLDSS